MSIWMNFLKKIINIIKMFKISNNIIKYKIPINGFKTSKFK